MENITYNDNALTLVVQPHWLQYCINYFPALFIWTILLVLSGLEGIKFVWIFKLIDISLSLFLLFKFIGFKRTKFKITDEQIIYKHGFLRHFSDYTELYRIIDYQENRTILQQLFGLKTVILNTTDRSSPIIRITGVASRLKLISLIRIRVEYNRKRKGIHEFTNSY